MMMMTMMMMVVVVVMVTQSSADKLNKQLESQLAELNNKFDVTQRELNDATAQKNHAQSEVSDLSRQLEEAENEVSQLSRAKQALTKKLDEAKSTADSETQASAQQRVLRVFFKFQEKNYVF